MKRAIIVLAIMGAVACGGDPKVPGETAGNPLSFHVKDLASGKAKADKKYLKVTGKAINFYAYTYREGKGSTEADAENFYFPIIPKGFNTAKDTLYLFAYCSPSTFKKVKSKLKSWRSNKEQTITGKKSEFLYKMPPHITSVFTGEKLKVAKDRVTIKLTGIDGVKYAN